MVDDAQPRVHGCRRISRERTPQHDVLRDVCNKSSSRVNGPARSGPTSIGIVGANMSLDVEASKGKTSRGRFALRDPAGIVTAHRFGDQEYVWPSMPSSLPGPTERIRFRRYRTGDAAAVSEMFADQQARRFYPDMCKPDRIEGWIRWNLHSYDEHGFGLWVIEHRDEGWFLGDCGLTYQLVEGDRLLELGYHLQHQYRGVGYATEAGRACLAYAFDELAAPLVCSVVDPTNTSSIRVASLLHTSRRAFQNGQGMMRELFWSTRR